MEKIWIESLKVSGLFGRYDHALPKQSAFSDVVILYGDNGVGKSTVLKLVFDLLSSRGDRGHRTALLEAPFQKIEVKLSNGLFISAERKTYLEIIYLALFAEHPEEGEARWDHFPKADGGFYAEDRGDIDLDYVVRSRPKFRRVANNEFHREKAEFLEMLEKRAPAVYMLDADRKLKSDAIPDSAAEETWQSGMRSGLHSSREIDRVAISRQILVSHALKKAHEWAQVRWIIASSQGSTNVHEAYSRLAEDICKEGEEPPPNANDFEKRLDSIERESQRQAEYGFAKELDTRTLRRALEQQNKQVDLARRLLDPYIGSLETRLSAGQETYKIMDNFIRCINELLFDKELSYSVNDGFRISRPGTGERLGLNNLSSGEQHLLILFGYVVSSAGSPAIFIIDEPEISLNVKWQRSLIKSLTSVTLGTQAQFMMASHSLELLSQHLDRVVELTPVIHD